MQSSVHSIFYFMHPCVCNKPEFSASYAHRDQCCCLEQAVQMMLICVVRLDFLMEKASILPPANVNL